MTKELSITPKELSHEQWLNVFNTTGFRTVVSRTMPLSLLIIICITHILTLVTHPWSWWLDSSIGSKTTAARGCNQEKWGILRAEGEEGGDQRRRRRHQALAFLHGGPEGKTTSSIGLSFTFQFDLFTTPFLHLRRRTLNPISVIPQVDPLALIKVKCYCWKIG